MTTTNGRTVVRDLARRYAEIAALPRQQETINVWRRFNGLKPTRPMVCIASGWGWDLPLPYVEIDDVRLQR